MLDSLVDQVSGSPVTYLVAFLAAIGDVIFPAVPSETILTTGGVVAARGELSLPLLIAAGLLGALLGDNLLYWLGRTVGEPVAERLFRSEKSQQRLDWGRRAVQRHGVTLILVGRFIPGGRTVATFAAGLTGMPWRRRFLVIDLVAVTLWALYTTLIGYFGGSIFQGSALLPIAAALGVGVVASLLVEVFRRVQKRRGKDLLGDELVG